MNTHPTWPSMPSAPLGWRTETASCAEAEIGRDARPKDNRGKMRAISLWQPWATAIALGVKRIETRGWETPIRGRIAIHAAKRWDLAQRQFASEEWRAGRLPPPSALPFGAIVATVELVDCVRTRDVSDLSDLEREYGDYAYGRFAWILADIKPLAVPIPFKGAQGFFNVPDDLFLMAKEGRG